MRREDLAQKMVEKTDHELLAMLKTPDDWTPEALECAEAELRKRGTNNSDQPSAVEQEPDAVERDDRADVYRYFGTYPNNDARLLLDAFVKDGIDYTLDVDSMGLARMSAAQAAYGGTSGAGVGIAIGVDADDCKRAMEIRQRIFKIVT